MNYMQIYNDVSLRCPKNKVLPKLFVPGQLYIYKYNCLVLLIKYAEHLTNAQQVADIGHNNPYGDYVSVNFIVYNGHLINNTSFLHIMYTPGCEFYKVENPLFTEILNTRVVEPIVPSLRMLAFNQLETDEQIEYAYAANVRGQFPPIHF